MDDVYEVAVFYDNLLAEWADKSRVTSWLLNVPLLGSAMKKLSGATHSKIVFLKNGEPIGAIEGKAYKANGSVTKAGFFGDNKLKAQWTDDVDLSESIASTTLFKTNDPKKFGRLLAKALGVAKGINDCGYDYKLFSQNCNATMEKILSELKVNGISLLDVQKAKEPAIIYTVGEAKDLGNKVTTPVLPKTNAGLLSKIFSLSSALEPDNIKEKLAKVFNENAEKGFFGRAVDRVVGWFSPDVGILSPA